MLEELKDKTQFVQYIIQKSKRRDMRISKREVECIYYLLHGMSAKQIGRKLILSPRTVEGYISSVKMRLRCYSKYELLEKVIQDLYCSSYYAYFLRRVPG